MTQTQNSFIRKNIQQVGPTGEYGRQMRIKSVNYSTSTQNQNAVVKERNNSNSFYQPGHAKKESSLSIRNNQVSANNTNSNNVVKTINTRLLKNTPQYKINRNTAIKSVTEQNFYQKGNKVNASRNLVAREKPNDLNQKSVQIHQEEFIQD